MNVRTAEAQRAAALLGAQLEFGDLLDAHITDGVETIEIIEAAIRELRPTHVYAHCLEDTHQDHRAVHAASLVAARDVPNVYCYQSPSSTVEFRPNRFVDITQYKKAKLQAIGAYQSQVDRMASLQDDVIVATARYWGRYAGHVLAEPMSIVRQRQRDEIRLRQRSLIDGRHSPAKMIPEGAPGEEATCVARPQLSDRLAVGDLTRLGQVGVWVMSQVDTHFVREYSSVGGLDRSPAMPALPRRHLGLGQNDKLSPTGSAELAAVGQELRRVVLVESDQYYREVLTVELLSQGFVVHAFADGASLLGSLASAVDADLAVLDWDLAKMPGIKLLAELRQHGVELPVVFLTGKFVPGNEQCVLASRESLNAYECVAFDQGAVDFIPKSRDREVLVRRLRSVIALTRSKADLPSRQHLACGKLLLNTEISRVFWNGVDVDLTLGEYKLVHLLVSNAGSFVTYRSLYDRQHFEDFIAGSGNDGFRANVRSAIKRIRNKFRACDPAFDKIKNYTGFGYGWSKPD